MKNFWKKNSCKILHLVSPQESFWRFTFMCEVQALFIILIFRYSLTTANHCFIFYWWVTLLSLQEFRLQQFYVNTICLCFIVCYFVISILCINARPHFSGDHLWRHKAFFWSPGKPMIASSFVSVEQEFHLHSFPKDLVPSLRISTHRGKITILILEVKST